jgi:hypothetical protein
MLPTWHLVDEDRVSIGARPEFPWRDIDDLRRENDADAGRRRHRHAPSRERATKAVAR